jgi:hypothetical protein
VTALRPDGRPPGCYDGEHSFSWGETGDSPPQEGARCICGATTLPAGRWVEATPELLDELYAEAWLGPGAGVSE